MKILQREGNSYRVSSTLSEFQEEFYIHLIDWKRANIGDESGQYRNITYDAILPDSYAAKGQMPHLYPPIKGRLDAHRKKNPFRIHKFFYHMASSQLANINLFLPILENPQADKILKTVKPDFVSIERSQLDNGYCLEYWGGNFDKRTWKGPLNDKSARAGTDSDIAIAYRDKDGQLCLWLIEHKLTEREFSTCGAYRRGRSQNYNCSQSVSSILENKNICYYHHVDKYRYWEHTDRHQAFFPNHYRHERCPFRGGMNQLWRNQLLGLAIEDDSSFPFARSTFSVLKHPENKSLDATIEAYKNLIGGNPAFSVLTSAKIVEAAENTDDKALSWWAKWYRDLYRLNRTTEGNRRA